MVMTLALDNGQGIQTISFDSKHVELNQPFLKGIHCVSISFVSCSCCDWLINVCQRKKELKARTVWLGCPEKCEEKHPRNSIKNQKYNVFTFIPGVR